MKICLIGCGWFGEALAIRLLANSHQVLGTTQSLTNQTRLLSIGIQAELLPYPQSPSTDFLNADVIVLNIPPFQKQLEWFRAWNWRANTRLVFISSTSVYGKDPSPKDEDRALSPETESGQILKEEEQWVQEHFSHWCILRFGGLLGSDRHPGKSLSGRKNLSGRLWPVNLLHQEDAVGFTSLVIEQNIQREIFNVVGDEHPGREKFYQDYCRHHALPLPEFDSQDDSQGPLILNSKAQSLYQFKTKL